MDNQKKMSLLEDMFEVEAGTLTPDMELAEIENWDSMMKLTLIVLMDDECGKVLKSDDIKKFHTIQDIMNFMD